MQNDRTTRRSTPQTASAHTPPAFEPRQHEETLRSGPHCLADRYRAAGRLCGRVALITGGDAGIGRAVAVLYAREGADVAIAYWPAGQEDAEDTRRAVEAEGRKCLLLPGELSLEPFCREIVERTVRELGGLNVLVHNAAYLNSGTDLSELSFEQWDRSFQVNMYAYVYLVLAARPHMEAGDAIIVTASEEALEGSSLMIDYATAKAAAVNFTKSIAPHLAKDGIRANVVVTGPTWGVINAAGQVSSEKEEGRGSPLGRVAQPEEIAPTYVFLASEAGSGCAVGEVIPVTVGLNETR